MTKKLLSILLACLLLLSCLPVFASADEADLPFALVAPANVGAHWLEGNDSPTTASIAYSLSSEMTDFFKRLENAQLDETFEEFMSQYNFDEISMTTQVDWAVDDVDDPISGWHANEYWNGDYGFGYDSDGRCRVGDWDGVDMGIGNATETINDLWVTRGANEDTLNGNSEEGIPGLKDQMNPDQYDYNEETGLRIDYTEHTVYYRMRFVVVTYTSESGQKDYYYSDWSNVAAVGKDAEVYVPVTANDLPKPEIAGFHLTDNDFNDQPVAAYTLTVPEELSEMAARVTAAGGGIRIETYCRVQGDEEWTLMSNADWLLSAGEREVPLVHLATEERPIIPLDEGIELRCRYACYQPGLDDVFSAFSEIVPLGVDAGLGDVNCDGSVDMKDVLLMRRFIVGHKINLKEELADVNRDGSIDMKDVLLTRKFIAKLIESF